MNNKTISLYTRHIASSQNIKEFLDQFAYYLKNDALNTIKNLIYIILDTDNYKINDKTSYNINNKFRTNKGLRMILSKNYYGKIRKTILEKGFISTADILSYYRNFYLINSNKLISTEGNCYEICYLFKDLIEYTINTFNFDNIKYQMIYTSTKHTFLLLMIDNDLYEFDPAIDCCYFGPARTNQYSNLLTIEPNEFEKFFHILHAQILFFENSYKEAKLNLGTIISSLKLNLIERLLIKINQVMEYPEEEED